MSRFIIITPAHNEDAFIAKTADSIIAQSHRPSKWVVVNDASTDRTARIIEQYAARYEFIQLVNVQREPGRHFGNKVRAFNLGLSGAQSHGFELIGNLDADISLEPNYFATILEEFAKDPRLGVAGGMVYTHQDGQYVSQNVALDSVAGAVQLFRWECFQQIGGYLPLPNGGIDAAAEIVARMKGWRTRTFPQCRVLEHRLTGSATARTLVSRIREGRRMHALGYSPLFFLLRCLYRIRSKPMVVGSAAALYGYAASLLGGNPPALPSEVVHFLRSEQRLKLAQLVRLKSFQQRSLCCKSLP